MEVSRTNLVLIVWAEGIVISPLKGTLDRVSENVGLTPASVEF